MGGAHHAGIDQHPLPVAGMGFSEEDDVDDRQSPIGYVGRDLVHPLGAHRIGAWIISAIVGI